MARRPLEEVQVLLNELRSEIRQLREEVARLQLFLPTPENLLCQRGFKVLTSEPTEHLLLPPNPTALTLDRYYRYLRRYSFRLFLRDVIRFKSDLRLERLLHYCSLRKATRYLQVLVDMGILEPAPLQQQTYRYNANPAVESFGDTLEWFVAQTLRREFRIPSSWGLSIAGLDQGGDFDVLGVLGSQIVYVETKASPPKNLHMGVVQGFVQRVQQLQPELAILLVDTHLRMEDKINKMVRVAFRESGRTDGDADAVQVSKGVFRMGSGLYTCNSKPAIAKNLRTCIRDYLQLHTE
ncbi:MAG: hypothetical protein ONB23_10780 [candidate division KSB1 bacterium]|nr:hypothetical protein [candidate division KSB1 bacterium]